MTETLLSIYQQQHHLSFLCVGVFAGWTVNEKLHEYMYAAEEENVHPEMLNSEGQWINEELLSVRFVDEDEYDDE